MGCSYSSSSLFEWPFVKLVILGPCPFVVLLAPVDKFRASDAHKRSMLKTPFWIAGWLPEEDSPPCPLYVEPLLLAPEEREELPLPGGLDPPIPISRDGFGIGWPGWDQSMVRTPPASPVDDNKHYFHYWWLLGLINCSGRYLKIALK